MANLQKIIKVTEDQYSTLASGGSVGGYTGLNDNYVYLVQDETTYITSEGGTIKGGLYFKDAQNHVVAAINADTYGSEIIYINDDYYGPLVVNNSAPIIYSENQDYNRDITLNTKELGIYDGTDSLNGLFINAEEAIIDWGNASQHITWSFPSTGGVLATESYVGTAINNLATVARTGSYTDLSNKPTIPTVNNATLTITQNNTSAGTFTANAATNVTIDIVTPQVKRFI